jgi:hypothetical protein
MSRAKLFNPALNYFAVKMINRMKENVRSGCTSSVGDCECCQKGKRFLNCEEMDRQDIYMDYQERTVHCVSCGRELS